MRGIRCQCIDATDINRDFLQIAQKAEYPPAIATDMLAEENTFFDSGGEILSPVTEIRSAVEFLPPCSFVDASFSEPYDVVFLTNALTYVTPEEQSRAFDNIASYNTRYLVTTSFHPAGIKEDMIRNGYVPVGDNREAIHNSWGDRLVADAPPDHSWMLPAYSERPDYEYRYCALFQKE